MLPTWLIITQLLSYALERKKPGPCQKSQVCLIAFIGNGLYNIATCNICYT